MCEINEIKYNIYMKHVMALKQLKINMIEFEQLQRESIANKKMIEEEKMEDWKNRYYQIFYDTIHA